MQRDEGVGNFGLKILEFPAVGENGLAKAD